MKHLWKLWLTRAASELSFWSYFDEIWHIDGEGIYIYIVIAVEILVVNDRSVINKIKFGKIVQTNVNVIIYKLTLQL